MKPKLPPTDSIFSKLTQHVSRALESEICEQRPARVECDTSGFSVGGRQLGPRFAVFAAVFCLAMMSATAWGATTYTWNATSGSAAWTTAGSWTPTRTTPATDDILVFNGGGSSTATAVPAQTIGKLQVSGNTTIILQAGAANTLTISGGAAAFSVASGSQLSVSGATALTINLPTGSSGSISGTIDYLGGAHKLTAADANGITFQSGSSFIADTGFSSNPFGTTSLNSIIFASGSTYISKAGSNPFGAASPNSVVLFQSGSLFSVQSSTTPAFSGRTYANVEVNAPAVTLTVTGGGAVSINDLTVTAGILNFNMTATPGHSIKGNISVASGAALNFAPASAGTVNLNGSSVQTIGGAGTITMAANSTLTVANSAGVNLNVSLPITGGLLTINNGSTLNISGAAAVSGTGAFTLGASATLGIGSAAGISSTPATGNIQVTGSRSIPNTANYIYNGTVNQVTGNQLPVTVNNLTINNTAIGGVVTETADITVTGTLTLTAGILDSAANNVTPTVATAVSGGSSSSYVNGKLAQVYAGTGAKTFPIGKNANYRPLALNYSTLTGTSTVIAEQNDPAAFPGSFSGVNISGTPYWTVTQSGGSAFTYDITLDGGAFAATTPVILKYESPNTTKLSASYSAPNYTASGLTSFSDFAVGDDAGCSTPSTPGAISQGNPAGASVCQNSAGVTYSIGSVSGATGYTWAVPSGASITAGQGTTSITVTWGTTSGNVTVTADNACGSSSPASLAVTVSPGAPATPGAITQGNPTGSTVCENSAGVTYSISPVSGASSYNWSVPAGASISAGQGTTAITVTWGTTAGNVSVTADNICGSSSAASLGVSLDSTAPATPGAITQGNPNGTTFCAGASGVTYTIDPVSGATSYTWTVPTGGTIQGSATGASITVNYSLLAVSGNVMVTANNTCGSSSAATLAVTVNPKPTAAVSGSAPICSGSSSILTATLTGSQPWSITWSDNVTESGITTSPHTRSVSPTSTTTYTITSVSDANCSATGTGNAVITVNSFQLVVATALNENMGTPGATTVVNSYTGWQSTSPIAFSSTSSAQSDVRTSAASTGYLGASGGGNVFFGTANGADRNLIITGINTTGFVSPQLQFGLDKVATGSEPFVVEVSSDGVNWTALTVPQPASLNTWTLTTASGAIPSTPNLSIRFSKNSTTAQYRLDDVKLLDVSTTASIGASGPTTFCAGGSVTLTANAGGASYVWSTSETTPSITVNASGTYTVTVSDANGCSSSASQAVTVNPLPTVTVNSAAVCAGGSALLTATTTANNLSYLWSPGGATTASITVAPGATTSYTVTVTDGTTGCINTGSGTVTVNPLPVVTITPATTNVECGSTFAFTADASGDGPLVYQWYDAQTNAIVGETNATLSVTNVHSGVAGNYTVVVTGPTCSASAVASLAVGDTLAPVITVLGANPATNECHVAYVDSGATALDGCAGSVAVTTTGTVNANAPGVYTVTYTADDGNGNTNSATRTVYVVDTTAPLVSVLGANPYTNFAYVTFVDPGATATDVCDALATVTTNGTVDITTPGTYVLEYIGADAAGNTATNTRTVEVIALIAPTITSEQFQGTAFEVTFTGPTGQPYRLLTSTDVTLPQASWTVLTTGAFGGSPVTYSDTTATNDAVRFYRVGSP